MSATHVVIVGATGRAAAASARRAGLIPTVVDLFADRDTRLIVSSSADDSDGAATGRERSSSPYGAAIGRDDVSDSSGAATARVRAATGREDVSDSSGAATGRERPLPPQSTSHSEPEPVFKALLRCPLPDYPNALPELVRQLPPGPVLYTGGLENHPELLDQLATDRKLLGNGSAAVASVRDPAQLRQRLADSGLRFPNHFAVPPPEVNYLVKRRDSSGGLGVRLGTARQGEFLEEFIPGQPMSAQFVNDTFLGATEQLVNEPWLHAPPFHYAGNLGPAKLSPPLLASFAAAARRLNLRGPWGIDFILQNDTAYVLEVNPRYTAALEVLELAHQIPLAFPSCSLPPCGGGLGWGVEPPFIGKAIYYAPRPLRFPPAGPWDGDLETPWNPWQIPTFADIPHPGESFDPGQPVLTFFAADSTPAAVRAKLMAMARDLDALFARESHP